jgi:hypothetical protein
VPHKEAEDLIRISHPQTKNKEEMTNRQQMTIYLVECKEKRLVD